MKKFLFIDSIGIYHTRSSYFPPQLPNLGSAVILSRLNEEKFIKTDYLELNVEFLYSTFIDDSSQIIHILKVLKNINNDIIYELDLLYKLLSWGEEWFKDYLKRIYSFFTFNSIKAYSNGKLLKHLNEIMKGIIKAFIEYIRFGYIPAFINNAIKKIKDINPDFIGISIFDDEDITDCLIQKIKKSIDSPIIGGGHISYIYTNNELSKRFIESKKIDYFLWGPAEENLVILLDILCKGNLNLSKVNNLFYLENNKAKFNEISYYHDNNKIPLLDFSFFKINKYFSPVTIFPLILDEGCYWKKCRFCSSGLKKNSTI